MKVKYEPSSGRLWVASSTTRAPVSSAIASATSARGADLVEDRRARPRPRPGRAASASSAALTWACELSDGDQRPDQPEVVAVGEVAQRLVAGHELAARRRGWSASSCGDLGVERRRGAPRASAARAADVEPEVARAAPAPAPWTTLAHRQRVGPDVGVVRARARRSPSAWSAPKGRSVTWSVAVKMRAPSSRAWPSASCEALLQLQPVLDDQVGLRQRARCPSPRAGTRGGRRRSASAPCTSAASPTRSFTTEPSTGVVTTTWGRPAVWSPPPHAARSGARPTRSAARAITAHLRGPTPRPPGEMPGPAGAGLRALDDNQSHNQTAIPGVSRPRSPGPGRSGRPPGAPARCAATGLPAAR